MLDVVSRIIELQKAWTHKNTPDMQERGELVRDAFPKALATYSAFFASEMKVDVADLEIKGRDGAGRKTAIPWVRICSKAHSPDPRTGWYIVFLFQSDGEGFYLCISHGSTDLIGGDFRQKPLAEMQPLMKWATELLDPFAKSHTDLTLSLDLGDKGKLGGAYEASTPIAKLYHRTKLPSEAELVDDLSLFIEMLSLIYQHEDLGQLPGYEVSEVQKAQGLLSPVTGRKVTGGQGFGLSTAERRVVELRAMMVAKEHLEKLGYKCTDTSANSSYDYKAKRGDEELIVEVKGTTSIGTHILLTANEVQSHRHHHPNNALCVVHSINLQREAKGVAPVASAGILDFKLSWDVGVCEMKALAYQVKL